ncbi:MAG: GH92 family glycosyl hydrolase [Terriglobia bacterium]
MKRSPSYSLLYALGLSLIIPSPSPTVAAPIDEGKPPSDGELVDYVNSFVGTAGPDPGNTFPGSSLPFGMIQWSPDGASFGKGRAGSYWYRDTAIRGFSLNHLSGPGCPVFGDVPIMPVVGPVKVSPASDLGAYAAEFSHAKETASPGFYEVTLETGVKVALTVTTRTGLGTFTFPASPHATVLIETGHNSSKVKDAAVEVVDDTKVAGSVSSGHFCGALNNYTVYFAAEFNRPFSSFGTWNGAKVNRRSRASSGPGSGAFLTFDTTRNAVVEMKVALSYVSIDNAWLNLHQENQGWDFAAMRQAARDKWNQELGLIRVGGGTDDEERVFYTALYHALLQPNVFTDVNGEYIGFDDKAHVAQGYTHYANYSGWDIYRTQVQLLALLHPKETSDMIQSLVVDEQQGGGLAIWPVANDDSCVMVGNPTCPIIASACAFGADGFDQQAALKAMVKGATQPGVRSKKCPQWVGLENYLKLGYLGPDSFSGPSQELEFSTAEFSIAQLAKALGDLGTYSAFMKRAQSWKNIFNAKTGYIEPRHNDGTFYPNLNPASDRYYVEGNAAQYSWMVPYNLRSLFDLMGGNEKVVARLDQFFTQLNAGPNRPYSWMGNEPGFAIPWAYDFAGAPWRTQDVVRRIETELFTAKPEGLAGNDDLGTMSAWYVFAAMGLYPEIPGVGGFCLNSPLFANVTWHLGNGQTVQIVGEGASTASPYVQSLSVDGKPYGRLWLPYAELMKGAALDFKLAGTPNKTWGSEPSAAPPSFDEGSTAPGR